MKQAQIEGHFPELRGNCYASGRGQAGTSRAAIARAVADLFTQPNVRGKRIHTVKMTVSLSNVRKADAARGQAEANCARCGKPVIQSEIVTDTDTDGEKWAYCSTECQEKH